MSWREIPAPAFSVVLPNKDGKEAKRMVDYLIDNKYIDLHTKVILVDLFVCVYGGYMEGGGAGGLSEWEGGGRGGGA